MADELLPPDVVSLISRHLSSIDHVSMVIALSARRGEPASARMLALDAQIAESASDAAIADLVSSGLVTGTVNGFGIARHHPDAAAADRLAGIYDANPIAVIRAIYERSASPALSFAEAFRIRRNST
ncbi:MAG: hypothetical protein M3Z17_01130 [Gemmatimonadota bacterium]|nr:hypothetical protein [Gemmatimonadota bacterium]